MSLALPKECAPCAAAIDAFGFQGAQLHAESAAQVLSTTFFDEFHPDMCPERYLNSMDPRSRSAVGAQIAQVISAQGGAK